VDHPAFEPGTISALTAEFERSPTAVVIPAYESRRGHPVLIARPVFGPLLALDPAQGANSVIRSFADQIRTIAVPDPGILVDVDDPESYHALQLRDAGHE
jgi:molybdenum cofactor cytidylyltransferase